MFEYHGWVTIRETTGAEDGQDGLLERVGRIAPGSYGLLHVWDDEGAHPNGFRVFRLVRGEVSEHADALLSPVVPTVEDPWSEGA